MIIRAFLRGAIQQVRLRWLRRAIHGSPLSLSTIAERAGILPLSLDEFLTGERTLRSHVLDRLAGILGYVLRPTK